MTPRFLFAALCVLGPLSCFAQSGNINGEATYISFAVPGASGTYPTGINGAMEVTGYYVTATQTRGIAIVFNVAASNLPGTTLTLTEQGVFLDGYDDIAGREEGTRIGLGNLDRLFTQQRAA